MKITRIAVIYSSIMNRETTEMLSKLSLRGILRRSDSDRRNAGVQSPCRQTEIGNSKKGAATKKIPKSTKSGKDNDSFQDIYTCKYCTTNDSLSLIQCKKWGCPSCTRVSVDSHSMIGKWNDIHQYCITCEPIVHTFCASKHGDDFFPQVVILI